MTGSNLEITTDAARKFLAWRHSRDEAALAELMAHRGYQTVLLHSDQLGLNRLTADDFRNAAAGRPNGLGGVRDLDAHEQAIYDLLADIDARSESLLALVEECLAPVFTPAERSDIAIHCIIGYDMGIGLSGNVAMNMNGPTYLNDPAEVGYWMAHEAAHVAYERVHGPLDMRRIREPGGLRRAVCVLIQTEGMSVYAPLAARLRAGQLADRDYRALLDPVALTAKTAALRNLVASLGVEYPGDDALGPLFGQLSGERLSYVVGCEIFRRTMEKFGSAGVRAALTDDPEEFVARGLAMLSQ
ncbi:MAG: hypothetical protein ACM3XN_00040 [Chloroflexota bacterium]